LRLTVSRKHFNIKMRVRLESVNGMDIRIGFELTSGKKLSGPYVVWEGLWDAYHSEFTEEKEDDEDDSMTIA